MSSAVDQQEVLELKAQQLRLKKRKLSLAKKFGLRFYRPHKKQEAFHQAAAYRRRMYRAGNRSGKSHCGVAEDCAFFLGYRPWYPEGHQMRTLGIPKHPTKGLIVTIDWDKVEEVFTGSDAKIWNMLPEGIVCNKKRNSSGKIAFFQNKLTGSTVRFETMKSYMMSQLSAESSDWDWVHWDEPPPHGMYKAISRGLVDRGGKEWFTLTPLAEPWINDLFYPNINAAKSLEEFEQKRNETPMSWVTSGSMYDNPHLTKEDIEDFESKLTEDEKACRIHGLPMMMSGLVYKEFDWDKHVLREVPQGWRGFNSPPKDWPVYISIDPHPQTPHAVIFMTVSPQGQKFIFDELFIHCYIERLVQYIEERTRFRGYFIAQPVKCDPLAWQEDPVRGDCMANEFMRCGLMVEKASKSKQHGIINMQQQLGKDNNIYVSPNCTRWLHEITHYVFDKENKPVDKDDHMMEATYRLLIAEPRYFNPQEDALSSLPHNAIVDPLDDNEYDNAIDNSEEILVGDFD